MSYRRYPNHNKVIDRDRIYLDDYVEQVREDVDVLIGSVGDSIKLLKSLKVVTHIIDHKGDITPKGRHGGRRQLQPQNIPESEKFPGKSEDINRPRLDNAILIPAILSLTPTDEMRRMYGFMDNESGTVTISTRYLDARKIDIDAGKDYFGIYGEVYKIRLLQGGDSTTFLDSSYVNVYTVRKDI
jgi:hypothetical protein